MQHRQVKKLPTLRGRTVINLFFEDSTRTRSSFEIAGKWMSADTINITGKGSSTSKGESLRDTTMTIAAMACITPSTTLLAANQAWRAWRCLERPVARHCRLCWSNRAKMPSPLATLPCSTTRPGKG